jgi:hypothetical protein
MSSRITDVRPVISSIGVDERGVAVIRIVLPNGSIRCVETNIKSFAELANAGVAVINGYR